MNTSFNFNAINTISCNSHKQKAFWYPQYILRVERCPKTQKLRGAGLFYSVHPLEINEKRGYYFICVSLTEYYAEEGVPYSHKKNDSHLVNFSS